MILAAISIQAITNTGIFTQANNAKRESEIASIKEQIALDIYEKQLVPPLGSITEEQLETILGKYGTIIYEEDGVTIKGITTAKGYEILLKDIYGGETVAETVPDGATVTPVNDITTWLKTGEISKQYSYTTIEQVIADSTCTESLMKNENAMKYLARSTEFANAICASETTMTSLGKSAHVDNTVLNSDIWKQKIKASQYWSLVYTTMYTIHAGASETITIDGVYGSFTTNADGSVNHALPLGELTLHGSVSGQSFTRTVTNDITEVYAMQESAIYWHRDINNLTGGWGRKYASDWGVGGSGCIYKDNGNYIEFYINSKASYSVHTNKKIDLSKYKKIYFECEITNAAISGAQVFATLSTTIPTNSDINGTYYKIFYFDTSVTKKQIISFDISDISSDYYLNLRAYSEGNVVIGSKIYKIWFE